MEDEKKFFLGNMELVIHETLNHSAFTDRQRNDIADDVLRQISNRLNELFPGVRFEITRLSARSGCIRVKVAIVLVVFATAGIAFWDLLGPAINKAIPGPAQETFCVINGRREPCKVVIHNSNLTGLTKRYQIQNGDTLSAIILDKWHLNTHQVPQVSRRIVQLYPSAFIDQDVNRLVVGEWIGLPPPPDKIKHAS